MVKCPFCQTEMDKQAIDIEMITTTGDSVIIRYTNRYRCQQCGVIDHLNLEKRVELP